MSSQVPLVWADSNRQTSKVVSWCRFIMAIIQTMPVRELFVLANCAGHTQSSVVFRPDSNSSNFFFQISVSSYFFLVLIATRTFLSTQSEQFLGVLLFESLNWSKEGISNLTRSSTVAPVHIITALTKMVFFMFSVQACIPSVLCLAQDGLVHLPITAEGKISSS